MRGEKGFALVVTLIVTTLMVAVLVELIHQVTVDVALSRSFRDGQQASLLAESGVTGGSKLLQLALQGQDYSSLSDSWAKPMVVDDESGTLEISISEESGRICINNLVQSGGELDPFILAAFRRIGSRLSIPEDAWDSLADWIDSDDNRRPNGAEKPYYQTMKPPYLPHNARLTSLGELSLVRGFTPERAAAFRRLVTPYTEPGYTLSRVNLNTAPKEVLAALDEAIDERMAERILEKRRLKPFRDTGELSLVPGAGAISQRLTGRVSVKGSLFRITAVARVSETARTVEAVWDNTGARFLSWQEY